MAVTDEVVQLVRASRDRTVELTDQQVVAITRGWVDAWDELTPKFADALTVLLATDADTIPASVIAKDRRLAQALAAARSRLDELAALTKVTITNDLGTAVLDAVDAHLASLQAQLPPEAPGVTLGTLNDDTLDAIVARSTQQIASTTAALAPAAEAAMRAELIRGITVGDNPNTVARRIMTRTEGAFNGGLARAARIARTEMLDAGRAASRASAQVNRDLITARIWIASLDSRTCGSCLAQHGTEWPVDQFGPEDHQQGRCTFVDKTKTWAELGFTGIEDDEPDRPAERDDWWNSLTEETQDRALGKTRADLLRNGDVTWADLSTRHESPDWRPSYSLTPVKDLLPQ
ncbi:phage minor head protein [Citricoccus sp. K5]|uniref:phage minor head protein n=1 Tax=Citricoccus sp. K5 TaxID=2653135 RepID=UPI0012F42309|nr:phage minor head protein [Citricoccus sp. K5]VXA92559.1 Phage head morphogenesis protein [Citricoccus sp. K5]VXA94978.1 Phage head morphogenesis protein [Citricoccus sp. K5]